MNPIKAINNCLFFTVGFAISFGVASAPFYSEDFESGLDGWANFVQESLGCGCPEEVFDKIELSNPATTELSRRINVGDRLLIYILDSSQAADLSSAIVQAVKTGVGERDSMKFNRFRLVIVAQEPQSISVAAEDAFSRCPAKDEKTHLHVVSSADIATF